MKLTVANKITLVRILAVPFFIAAVLHYTPENDYLRYVALGIFSFAVISDGVDGYIARKYHQKTKAGALLDPLADKLLLISAFICLYKVGTFFSITQFPIWLVVAVISRDVILLIGSMILYLLHVKVSIDPSFSGKTTTVLQMCCILGVLVQFKNMEILWYLTALISFISLVGYIQKGIQILNASSESNT